MVLPSDSCLMRFQILALTLLFVPSVSHGCQYNYNKSRSTNFTATNALNSTTAGPGKKRYLYFMMFPLLSLVVMNRTTRDLKD